jgi:hypothetical protein
MGADLWGADLWNADDADGYDKARIIFCGGV